VAGNLVAGCGAFVVVVAVWTVPNSAWAADPATDRRALQAERSRLAAAYAAEEAACEQRFAVTACREDVRLRRRDALDRLRSQELALDDQARQQRADERRAAVRARQQQAAERTASGAAPDVQLRPPRAAASAPRASTDGPRRAVESEVRRDAGAVEAEARVREAAARRAQAASAAERVRARQAAREASGKKVQPLPVPASAAGR
jgi:colicin import membrane protein